MLGGKPAKERLSLLDVSTEFLTAQMVHNLIMQGLMLRFVQRLLHLQMEMMICGQPYKSGKWGRVKDGGVKALRVV
tara:strand:- start:17 stop:244 length:228 start_codon:yes stop_codon:yes gene_type:complete